MAGGSKISNNIPLMAENLMLRGSRVKNTEWGVGCAIYIGANTKLALNSKLTYSKTSTSEKFINRYLLLFMAILIIIAMICYIIKIYFERYQVAHPSVFIHHIDDGIFQSFFSYIFLFNYIIPISLYVTIEMHMLINSLFMEWDLQLYDAETDQPCIVNTSNLNEDLGQINILFSDKTGTLTRNEMIFQQCSIDGKKYLQIGRRLQEEGAISALTISELPVC